MKQVTEHLPRSHENDWAFGCPKCKFGLAVAPAILPAISLYEGRAVQAAEQLLVFCECRAGHMYRQQLRKVYATLSMEQKRNVLAHIQAASVPTIHGEMA